MLYLMLLATVLPRTIGEFQRRHLRVSLKLERFLSDPAAASPWPSEQQLSTTTAATVLTTTVTDLTTTATTASPAASVTTTAAAAASATTAAASVNTPASSSSTAAPSRSSSSSSASTPQNAPSQSTPSQSSQPPAPQAGPAASAGPAVPASQPQPVPYRAPVYSAHAPPPTQAPCDPGPAQAAVAGIPSFQDAFDASAKGNASGCNCHNLTTPPPRMNQTAILDNLKMVAHLGAVAAQEGLDALGNKTATRTANESYDLALKGSMIWQDNSNKLQQANEASAWADRRVAKYEADTQQASEAYQRAIAYDDAYEKKEHMGKYR